MKGRILLVHGEGLGNIVEALPLVKALERSGMAVDVALAKTSYDMPRSVFPGRRVYLPGEPVDEGLYAGKVETSWGRFHGKAVAPGLKTLNAAAKQVIRMDRSEVEVYVGAAKELGAAADGSDFDCRGMLGFEPGMEKFDVVMADGYSRREKDTWKAKSWPGHEGLAEKLVGRGLRVCSVGQPGEAVKGAEDRTGLPLPGTLGIVAKASVVVANDSGLYHCACALGVPVVVVFTFTSAVKNWDARFHAGAKVVFRKDLACRAGCQERGSWRKCGRGFECRNVSVGDVLGNTMEVLNGNGKRD